LDIRDAAHRPHRYYFLILGSSQALEEPTNEASSNPSRLANYFTKALLFIGLFLLAVLFISTCPFPMTEERMRWWSGVLAQLGIRDARGSWVFVTLLMDLVVAVLVYLAIAKRLEPLASEASIIPIAKSLLFGSLFVMALSFVHTPATDEYAHWWFVAAGRLGIRESEDLEFFLTLFVDLLVTIFVYIAIMKRWGRNRNFVRKAV
jgi:uncharacterized membrane protein HdeD (DUF308 family)